MYIVAPAGDINKFYAAVDGGAHEIYMGLQGLGARKSAKNFTMSEYKAALEYAHERGSRVFLTLNTVMMDNEFNPLFINLNTLYKCGLDAIIVQDLGMFKFLKENFPEIEIHGSTQMTISNHVEAEYLRELGFKRVVLSRELSFEEIKEIRKNTTIELEVFVSGALCVAYSGKCFMSSFIGARSGNRGMCAQPCRKNYESSTGEKGFLLSPKDQLMGKKEIDMLKEIGIESIKLEGRMKDEQYVYELTSYYKELIDGNDREERVSSIFNRGYGKGYFYGREDILNRNYSSNLGKQIGIVSGKEVLLSENLKFGDGITFLSKSYEKLGGTNVSKISVKRDTVRYRSSDANKDREAVAGDTIVMMDLPVGTRYIFKNHCKELEDAITKERHSSEKKIQISAEFSCKLGELPKLTFKYKNLNGKLIEITKLGSKESEAASKRGATSEDIYSKIAELGETTFYLLEENFTCNIDENLFIPVSIIKALKRDVAEDFADIIVESYRRENSDEIKVIDILEDTEKELEVIAIVKTKEQEKVLIDLGIKKIYKSGLQITTERNVDIDRSNKGLAYNFYDIVKDKDTKVMTHWSFNITNSYTLRLLESILNIESVMLSPELSFEKIKNLTKTKFKKALLVYSKPKVMHIETKIVQKNSYLVNDMGDEFGIIINENGNSEIYLNKALDITDRMKEIKKLNIDQIVIEISDENEEKIREIIAGITEKKSETKENAGYNYWKGVY
ncbi:MAG: peptidase U32 family protein [Fusobacteriaceae bacterium]